MSKNVPPPPAAAVPGRAVVIIGAGPAGLLAGISAARLGATVTILERNARAGVKLALTGQGRCNIANAAPLNAFFSRVNNGLPAVKTAVRVFFRPQLYDLFRENSITFHEEDDGRIFPVGTNAKGIGDILAGLFLNAGGRIEYGVTVSGLVKTESGRITSLHYVDKEGVSSRIAGDAFVLAAGGSTWKKTGSDGSGFSLAESLGHTVVNPLPALAGLLCAGTAGAAGASCADATAAVWVQGRKLFEKRGAVLFTHEGLSGPAILNLSGSAIRQIDNGEIVDVTVDPFPGMDEKEFDELLLERIAAGGRGTIHAALRPLAGPAVARLILDICKIDPEMRSADCTAVQRKAIRCAAKPLRFSCTGAADADTAMVTTGGIDTTQIEPRTMQSRVVSNLFCAGEVLDIDADTGGFNLQIAFATGFLAGRSAASLTDI